VTLFNLGLTTLYRQCTPYQWLCPRRAANSLVKGEHPAQQAPKAGWLLQKHKVIKNLG